MAMNLGEASARITLDISDLAGKSAQAQGILSDMDGAVGKSTSGFGKFQNALMGFGAAMIPAVGVGLSMAIDLEQAMANVNATLGGLDTSVLSELEQGFMDIGAASQFSAIEVAAVGDEIARAGFATEDIVDMTRSVVELSQATGTDLMTSVSGITSVMQIWSPAIVEADIALTDAARAADIFTVAANASSADVQDIIAGMRNFGPTAASIGIGFDEASGAIAYFTNYGLKAANAGVSMTRAIQNLQDPTAEAAELMQELGISVFDMEGNFVGLPTLFDQLNVAMADMTPEARNMALTTLFGAEAIDVMTVAAMTGGDPLRMILGLMEETGVAAEQSALRMDTLKAQFGELVESVTNLLGRMMGGLIPALRLFVDVANMVVNVLSRIPQPILAAIGAVMGLAAAFATLRGAAAGLQILSRLTGIAVPGGALFGGLATGLLAVAAAAGVAYAAIRFNLFGIGDAVSKFTSIWNNLADSAANNAISRFLISLGQALQTFDIDALDTIGRGLNALGRGVNAFFDGFRGPGAKDMETTTKHFEGFAELAEDGVTWKVKSEGGEELGEIIDSWDNADGTTTVRIRTKGGEEFETTIDMATAFISEDYEVEVEVDAKDARKTLDRVQDGLDAMTKSLEKSMFPALARFPRAASRAIDSIKSFTEGFRMARDLGNDFVTSTLRGLGTALPFLRADLARFEMGWRDLQDSFAYFRDQGLNPVEAGLMALGQIFPELETAMIGLYGVVDGLGDAFAAALRGDWAGAFEGLEQAARSAWVVIGEIAGGIGGLVVDLVNWTINTGVPAVTGWIADNAGNVWSALSAAAGWVWDGLVALGAWTLNTAVPAITGWISDNAGDIWSGIKAAAGWVWDGIADVGTITLEVAGWLVDSAQTAWEAIKQWVLGTGSGLSGAGRASGGGLAAAAGTGIPIGPVRVQITEWDIVADIRDLWSGLNEWLDDNFTVSDEDVAAWEPRGREIGSSIMRSIIDGIKGAFSGAEGGEGPSGPDNLHEQLWAYLKPVLDGAWAELQPELENWGTQMKRDMQLWWNSFAPSLLQFDTLAGSPTQQGGDAAMRGLADAIAGPTVFESVKQDLQSKWDGFKQDIQGIFDDIPTIELPNIDIDWGGFGESIAEGWQGAMDLFQNVLDWLKSPWENVGAITISLPSIDIDWGPIDDIIEAGNEKKQALIDLIKDLTELPKDPVLQEGSWKDTQDQETKDQTWDLYGPGVSAGLSFVDGVRSGLDNVGGTVNAALTAGLATVGPTVSTAMLGAQIAMQTSMSTIGMAIGTQAASWGTNLATGLQSLTTTSTTAFLGMQLGIATSMATIGSTITTQASSWGTALSAGMTTMTASATTSMATIGTVVQAGMTIATAAVRAGGSAMSSAMASAGAAMASAAAASAAQTASVLVTGMALATAAVRNAASQWPGIIAAAGGAMYSAGYSVGAAAGQGVVAGLLSMLGAVQAAANAIVSTAMGAMAAAAAIASPSKVTTGYGQMMGQGLIVGMRQMQPAVARQSASLMAMAAPTPYTPSAGAMGGNISNTTTVIQVDTHIAGNIIGNDDFADEMADRTAWKIASVKQRRDLAKGVAW